jgi:glutamine amidotransferase
MIVIIDYGMGNLRSVQKKIERIGLKAVITDEIKTIEQAEKIILPGVGHFANGVKNIKQRGIWDILNKKVLNDKTPILGICLGMQLMARFSEEGNEDGFGWFDAEVVKFRVSNDIKFKIPHIGWNSLNINRNVPFLIDITNESQFYFVHSYHLICNNKEDELTSTEYDYHFTSSISKNNIIGVQFHPEKSHDQGEVLLKNFITHY